VIRAVFPAVTVNGADSPPEHVASAFLSPVIHSTNAVVVEVVVEVEVLLVVVVVAPLKSISR
jgi:hypothetical protein